MTTAPAGGRAVSGRSILRFIVFMAALAAGVWLLRSGRLGGDLTPAALQAAVERSGRLAPLLFAAAVAVLPNLMVPMSALVIAGGLLFGWFTAFGLAMAGAVGSHVLGYLISAALLRDQARALLARFGWLGVLERIESDSAWRMAFLARFTPIPVGAQNYLLGITRVPVLPYLTASATAHLPWIFVFSTVGSTARLPVQGPFLIGLALYTVLVLGVDAWWSRRKKAGDGRPAGGGDAP